MAKVTIKGKKVTGTKKKDKITWVKKSAWKKALTVNAGAGNDTINFSKSTYKNTLNGQGGNDLIKGGKKADKINGGAGKDTIYGYAGNDIITGGKGNDLINAGKGNNSIYFAKKDGKDTILNGGGSDTLVFTNEKLANIKAKYSGNNAILTYTGGKITLKNYKKGHSVKYIQVGKTKKAMADIEPYNWVTPKSSHLYEGTNRKDKIVSTSTSDTIRAYNGNDLIEIVKGESTVYAGKGNDAIIVRASANISDFYFNPGDGNDTITYQDGCEAYDSLHFNNINSISNMTFNINKGSGYTLTYNNGNGPSSVKVNMPKSDYNYWKNEYKLNGFANIYSDHINRFGYAAEVILNETQYYDIAATGLVKKNAVTLQADNKITTSNKNDYVSVDSSYYDENYERYYSFDSISIKTLNGNDYIKISSDDDYYFDEYYDDYDSSLIPSNDPSVRRYKDNEVPIIDIYAGKGNDTISCSWADLYFNNGDGNDIVNGYYNRFFFDDETEISNLNIRKLEDKSIKISYNNNKDSVTISSDSYWDDDTDEEKTTYPSGEIGVKYWDEYDNDWYYKKYTILETDKTNATICTNDDDEINFSMYSKFFTDDFNEGYNGFTSNNLIIGKGNDTVNLIYKDDDENKNATCAYFNINDSGDILGNTLTIYNSVNPDSTYIEFYGYYYGEEDTYHPLYKTLFIDDYFSKEGTITINLDDKTLDMSKIEDVKSAVAGWLSTEGYADVSTAINDETKGAENLAVLLGSDYFGKLEWT